MLQLPDYRVRQRDYLLEILRALTEELDLQVLLKRILRISVEVLSGQAGFIALLDDAARWQIAVHQGLPEGLIGHLEKQLSFLPDEITENNESHIQVIIKMVSDISMGMVSGVGISMVIRKEVIGLIYVFRNTRVSFSQNDHSLLNSFADQAAIAVRNARLYKDVIDHNLRISALLDSVADGIVILSPDITILDANMAFCRLANTARSSLIGKSCDQAIQWQGEIKGLPINEAFRFDWQHHTRMEMFIEGDMVRRGNLPPLPVSINYAPLFNHDKELINIIASVRDISRHREAENLKTNFMSVISHELKTPIALIKGYANTLRRDDIAWNETMIAESLAVIEDEADHLAAMVEDLLDATRLQTGGLALRPGELDIVALIDDRLRKHNVQSDHKPLKNSLPKDFPLVYADPTRINQLLNNLISNSFKYASDGEIVFSGEVEKNMVKICVSDHGPGFDPMDVPHAFDRFYRSDQDSKTSKGTGLGLFLCKAIVEAHGGRIWIDEKYTKGARICFTLPRFIPKFI